MVAIVVRNNNVDQAMRVLKKKLQKEGVLREIKADSILKNHLQREPEKRQRVSNDTNVQRRKD